jgi:hypothetical protein
MSSTRLRLITEPYLPVLVLQLSQVAERLKVTELLKDMRTYV